MSSADCISRAAAIDAIESHLRTIQEPYRLNDTDEIMNYAFEVAASCVYNLPSAEPEWKKPDHGYMWICPECGLEVHSDFVRCVRCGWERTSADLTCDGCVTPKTICGICMRNYPNITDHYCVGEAWKEI